MSQIETWAHSESSGQLEEQQSRSKITESTSSEAGQAEHKDEDSWTASEPADWTSWRDLNRAT